MPEKDNHPWLNKLSIPRIGAPPEPTPRGDYERLQKEVHELRRALRWSMGFIVNFALGMEITEGMKVETGRIRQGIKEGLKKSSVPRGILTSLDDVPAMLKEWDFKTFRVEQDLQVQERTAGQIVLKHEDCPAIFKTMRQSASFLISRVNMDYYVYLPSALDFLCVPHTLCRSVLINWLSDGKFEVEELYCRRNTECGGVCAFAVKLAPVPSRRSGEGSGSPPKT